MLISAGVSGSLLTPPGGGSSLKEANGDIPPAGWGRIFTTGLTIMGLHFQ